RSENEGQANRAVLDGLAPHQRCRSFQEFQRSPFRTTAPNIDSLPCARLAAALEKRTTLRGSVDFVALYRAIGEKSQARRERVEAQSWLESCHDRIRGSFADRKQVALPSRAEEQLGSLPIPDSVL